MSAEDRPLEEAKTSLGLAGGGRLYVGLLLLLLALGSSLAALLLFPQDPPTGAAWNFHLAGIVLFAVAIPFVFRGAKEVKPAEPLTLQVATFGLIILGLAIFMRFYRLNDLPFGTWFDEADIGIPFPQRVLHLPDGGVTLD